jgi:hypothetical protein
MDYDSGEARQQWMCSLSDNPEQYRQPPFSAILSQCQNARYGDDDESGISALTCKF